MGKEIVTVRVGGNSWTGFTSIELESAFDHGTDKFSMVTPAFIGSAATAATFSAGMPLTIFCNDDLAFTGFVDRYQPSIKGRSPSTIGIAGRGKSQDFVDSAAMHSTGRFENQNLMQIAQQLDEFSCGFSTDQDLSAVAEYQITPGETAFAAIERLSRKQGLTLAGQPDGTIKITKAGTTRHSGGLFEGVNIIDADGDFNWAHRHSKIIVRGQQPDNSGATALQIEATSQDTAVNRNRPLVLIEDGDLTADEAQERADTRRDREAGESLKASVTVQGFRDDTGTLWTPGNLVWTESTFLNIAQLMMIKHRKLRQNRKGSFADLTLVDPRAFGGKAGKGGSAGSDWSIDDQD